MAHDAPIDASAGPHACLRKHRPDIRAALAAARASEVWLDVGEANIIRPAVSVGFDMMAASVIAAIDQHVAHAGGAHFAEGTRGMYKYLSNQAHSLPMAFSRTLDNSLYTNDSAGAKVTAGFGIEFARKALGRGCVHMLYLFPDTELAIDQIISTALKTAYFPTKTTTP